MIAAIVIEDSLLLTLVLFGLAAWWMASHDKCSQCGHRNGSLDHRRACGR